MARTADYFQQAQLSVAAYALNLQQGMSDSTQALTYISALKQAGMSNFQATEFAKSYVVIDQYTDSSSGLSATIFDKDGVKYFAIRGTEAGVFSGAQDWLTNVADVSADGIAISQGVALMNYLQRLQGVAGNPVVQYVYNSTFRTMEISTGTANGLLSTQQIPMSVTGHSLGGHLAMMMSRLVPSMVNAVYTYNAPGFDTNIRINPVPLTSNGFFNLLRNASIGPITGQIGGQWNGQIMTHLNVPGDIVSGIGTAPGIQQIAFSESAHQGAIDAHSMAPLTDALAVYDLLGSLDPALTLDRITPILEAGSLQPKESLESVVDAVGDLFGAGSEVAIDDREELYTRIQAITNDPLFQQAEGLSKVAPLVGLSRDELVSVAGADTPEGLAYRYALVNLNPFAVTGSSSLYSGHNSGQELDLYESSTGTGALTEWYLQDRARFLALLNERNLTGASVRGEAIEFYDKSSDELASYDNANAGARRRYHFGGVGADLLKGGADRDHLYGGSGNDTLQGSDGEDYLEGGDGSDIYRAGNGDIIFDRDGNGELWFGNTKLTGGPSSNGGAVYTRTEELDTPAENERITYLLYDDLLNVQKWSDASHYEGSLFVRNFKSGDLGITLGPVAQPPVLLPVAGTSGDDSIYASTSSGVVSGTLQAEELHGLSGNDEVFGNGGRDHIYGDEGSDILYGREDRDVLYGGPGMDVDILNSAAGNDRLYGGAGNDSLSGGAGSDEVYGENGNDLINGGWGADILVGGDGDDFIIGDGSFETSNRGWSISLQGNTYLLPMHAGAWGSSADGSDIIHGGAGVDLIWGGGENDFIDGGSEGDRIEGNGGSDMIYGGAGNDVILGAGGPQYSYWPDGADYLYGGEGDDQIAGFDGRDFIDGGPGNDQLWGGAAGEGNALYQGAEEGDYIFGGEGDDELYGDEGGDELSGGSGRDLLIGATGDDRLEGGADDDQLFGNEDNDRLAGGSGADLLRGGAGVDTLYGGEGRDELFGDEGEDVIDGGAGNDHLVGGAGDDLYRFAAGSGNDVLLDDEGNHLSFAGGIAASDISVMPVVNPAGEGQLFMQLRYTSVDSVLVKDGYFGTIGQYQYADGSVVGNASVIRQVPGEEITGSGLGDYLTGTEEADRILAYAGNDKVWGGGGSDWIEGGAGDDHLYGDDGDDVLLGGSGMDFLYGHDGQDYLDGGAGYGFLNGGTGSDVYLIGSDSDGVTITDVKESVDPGNNDIVRLEGGILPAMATPYRYGNDLVIAIDNSPVEIKIEGQFDLSLKGVEQVMFSDGTVWDQSDLLSRTVPTDVNAFTGGSGDDTFIVDHPDDVVSESPGGGTDTIISLVSYRLPDNVENLTLTGPLNLEGVGNGLDNVLIGNDGNNMLKGMAMLNQDVLIGGLGDDTYVVSEAAGGGISEHDDSTRIVEQPGEGTDTVLLDGYVISYVLPENVENLRLVRTTSAYQAFLEGNDLDNVIEGSSVYGTYLDGGAGADRLIGSIQADTYVIDNAGDQIIEPDSAQNSRTDRVYSAISYTLGEGLEELYLTGAGSIDATGNTDDNRLVGSSGNNLLSGLAGTDLIDGGWGDDTYLFNLGNEIDIIEADSNGNDRVLFGQGITAYMLKVEIGQDAGGSQDLVIMVADNDELRIKNWFGSYGSRTRIERFEFSGGETLTAADIEALIGQETPQNSAPELAMPLEDKSVTEGTPLDYSLQADAFSDPDMGDVLSYSAALANGSPLPDWMVFDTATSAFSGIPGSGDVGVLEVEVVATDAGGLSVSDSFRLTIESINNTVTGDSGDDTLTGTGDDDVISGLDGNDRLYGRGGDDRLIGGAGNDRLNGGVGNDTLEGGSGDDIYVVDSAGDSVIEAADGGTDRVVSYVDYSLGDHIERLTLGGGADLNGTGNGLDNRIWGNSGANSLAGGDGDDRLYGRDGDDRLIGSAGNDRLNGGVGNDTLEGGSGDDLYVVDSAGDSVIEAADGGTDRVISYVDYSLGDHIERLTLGGGADLNGAGNGLDNRILGNSGANGLAGGDGDDRLYGRDGDDRLIGGADNDRLNGGAGDDSYQFNRGSGRDTLIQASSDPGDTDRLLFGEGISAGQLWFGQRQNHLEVGVIGTEDHITLRNWYSNADQRIDEFHTFDNQILLESSVQQLVSAMAAFSPPPSGQLTLPEGMREQLDPVIAAAWTGT